MPEGYLRAGDAAEVPEPEAKDARQRVFDKQSLNTGPPPSLAARHFITPTELFFTRSHAPVPAIDSATWRLRVHGLVDRQQQLSLDDLKQNFAVHELASTLVCAGLRRNELSSIRPIPRELPWGLEPVSTGLWRGTALRDVLLASGIPADAKHVCFTGLDEVERRGRRFGFGGSIPLEKALSPEVMLAYELNGRPLGMAHGFPVRVVVPGYIGARSVKWLGKIELSATPSANYFQADAYRILMDPCDSSSDVSSGVEMSDVAINAVILVPECGAWLPPGEVEVSGWALGLNGVPVTDIECSGDGGITWTDATVYESGSPWTWRLWRATLNLTTGSRTLVVRCTDAQGVTQPAELDAVWNVKGYGNNAWHRVPVEVG